MVETNSRTCVEEIFTRHCYVLVFFSPYVCQNNIKAGQYLLCAGARGAIAAHKSRATPATSMHLVPFIVSTSVRAFSRALMQFIFLFSAWTLSIKASFVGITPSQARERRKSRLRSSPVLTCRAVEVFVLILVIKFGFRSWASLTVKVICSRFTMPSFPPQGHRKEPFEIWNFSTCFFFLSSSFFFATLSERFHYRSLWASIMARSGVCSLFSAPAFPR